MKPARGFVLVMLFASAAQLACALLVPGRVAPPVESTQTPLPRTQASTAPSAVPTVAATAEPSAAPATAIPAASATPAPAASPTAEALRLEVLQIQAWNDNLGHARVNVLLRNPYDFPVAPSVGSSASLRNGAGEFIRSRDLYFLDGISGGAGFVMPGETIAANACFTCETTPLPEAWASVEVLPNVEDASDRWQVFTAVSATLGNAEFDESAIFWVDGTITNNTDGPVQRISARVLVYDATGALVGAAEASAWDVPAGATVSFSGYGFGQAPSGPAAYEVTALGVHY